MTKPLYQYQIQLQGSSNRDLLKGTFLEGKLQVLETAPSLETTESILREGGIMFYVRKSKEESHAKCFILAPATVARLPSLTLPTQMEATKAVNACDELINQAWGILELDDRKLYEHMLVGLPDKQPAVPV